MTSRTMIYLETELLQTLKKRARAERISVAALVRRLVRRGLESGAGVPRPSEDVYSRLVGLGASGRADIADAHDSRLAEALTGEHLR